MSIDHSRVNDLLCAAAQRDRVAFAELYRLTSPMLFALARRMMPDPADAKDVLQDSYVRIWERAGVFDPALGRALSWMAAIVRHGCLDRLRVRQRAVGRETSLDEAEDLALPEAGAAGLDIARCMAGLSEPERDIIVLAVQQGLSHSEVSESLTMPLGTVKSHVRRGLVKLRLCLESVAGHA